MADKVIVDQVYVQANEVLATSLDEQEILMSMEEGQFVELNRTGRAIWQRLDGERSLAELIAELCDIYEISPDVCEADVLKLAGELRDLKLITLKG